MEYDFSIYMPIISSQDVYCNLNKGDYEHKMDQYIKFNGAYFSFIDYQAKGSVVENMKDYTTVHGEAEIFQESLIFDKKYLCTLEEVIELQQKMKEYRRIYTETGSKDRYRFKL
ncbi:hypothetical protein vBEcoMphAPEC6_00545 [Escherichia phage ph0011]|nr:hypothetical protein vBEcoMphAPEC6_00545 [Escherichia phage ph0011]